jgi:hypothetical protein
MGQQQHNAIIPNRSGIIGRWLAERALCCQPERIRADRGVGSPRPFTSQSIWRPYTITIFFKRSLKSMKLQFAQSACDQRRRACSGRILLLRGSSSYPVQEFQALERFAFVFSEPESVRSWCAIEIDEESTRQREPYRTLPAAGRETPHFKTEVLAVISRLEDRIESHSLIKMPVEEFCDLSEGGFRFRSIRDNIVLRVRLSLKDKQLGLNT